MNKQVIRLFNVWIKDRNFSHIFLITVVEFMQILLVSAISPYVAAFSI